MGGPFRPAYLQILPRRRGSLIPESVVKLPVKSEWRLRWWQNVQLATGSRNKITLYDIVLSTRSLIQDSTIASRLIIRKIIETQLRPLKIIAHAHIPRPQPQLREIIRIQREIRRPALHQRMTLHHPRRPIANCLARLIFRHHPQRLELDKRPQKRPPERRLAGGPRARIPIAR